MFFGPKVTRDVIASIITHGLIPHMVDHFSLASLLYCYLVVPVKERYYV